VCCGFECLLQVYTLDSTSAWLPWSLEFPWGSASEPDDLEIQGPSSLAVENDLRGSVEVSYDLYICVSNTRSRYQPRDMLVSILASHVLHRVTERMAFSITPIIVYLGKPIEPVPLSIYRHIEQPHRYRKHIPLVQRSIHCCCQPFLAYVHQTKKNQMLNTLNPNSQTEFIFCSRPFFIVKKDHFSGSIERMP
jgi:hypothetical protein